jgi:hypothetical protein
MPLIAPAPSVAGSGVCEIDPAEMVPAEMLNAVEKALDLVAARIDHLEERMLLLDVRSLLDRG